jgi:lipid-binding SYLF domain-containing protein
MTPFFLLPMVLAGSLGSHLWAQASPANDNTFKTSAAERLAKSSAAVSTFREAASDSTQTLLSHALCIVVAPRRDPDLSAIDVSGFASCRPNPGGDWSNPAAVVIEGGGVFWPVFGSKIDVILLTTNPSTARHFGDPLGILGGDLGTRPGPVRPDQMPVRISDPVIFVYEQSADGIGGFNIAGAAMNEDKATNAALYGNELSNLAILWRNGGGRGRTGVDQFLLALSSSGSRHVVDE